MDKIKKINEFFGTDNKEIIGLTEQEITQLLDYAYEISNAFDTYQKRSGVENKLALVKTIKVIGGKYQAALTKLANTDEANLLMAPKTKN